MRYQFWKTSLPQSYTVYSLQTGNKNHPRKGHQLRANKRLMGFSNGISRLFTMSYIRSNRTARASIQFTYSIPQGAAIYAALPYSPSRSVVT
jgi:hypothetical protein